MTNRLWIGAVAAALAVGVGVLVLARPEGRALTPEARAMAQLRGASIHEPDLLYIRASGRDPQVICGIADVRPGGQRTPSLYFVSTRDRVVLNRAPWRQDNPEFSAISNRYCPGLVRFVTPVVVVD